MADEKELRKMNRTELIEIIYALQQDEENLRKENEQLRAQLNDRVIRIDKAGSIAEAALSLNHIFEDAENAAKQYLLSVRKAEAERERISSQADAKMAEAEKKLADAQKKADQILQSANARANAITQKAKAEVEAERDQFIKSVNALLQ